MAQQCNFIGCTTPAIAKGLCNTHYKRQYRNGSLETLRPDDWGDRRKHEAYPTWKTLSRMYRQSTDPRWIEDFWIFAKEVPPKPPNVKATGARPDPNAHWGPDNFYWKESRFGDLHRADKAAYMREWSRSTREANPDYGKNLYLKRAYGVDLAWFNTKMIEQDGKCAICQQPETAIIHGKPISLSVDHCHDKGHARGLLCSDCNRAIGMLKDDPEILRAAIRYLESDAGDLV